MLGKGGACLAGLLSIALVLPRAGALPAQPLPAQPLPAQPVPGTLDELAQACQVAVAEEVELAV